MIPAHDITGLILAGGRGSRMGHSDKGLTIFRGMALAQHAAVRLSPQVNELVISANRNADAYRAFGAPVYADEMQGHVGPLAGMHTGLMRCVTPYMVSTPCDAPFLPRDLVQRLTDALIAENADAAVVRTIENSEFRLQPVFCLMKTSLLSSLTAFLRDGGRKVKTWQATLKMATANYAEAEAFRNINTPEDLRSCEAA